MLSTHILDTSTGTPAPGVEVLLEKRTGESWVELARQATNVDGRISFDCPREPGRYRLTFGVETYWRSRGQTPFFLDVPVAFEISDVARKYHVPLLLSPFGLSTYRGS